MYPIFHEPTFTQDVEDVYSGSTDPYQNYCLRMVIAISLQKMDTQYAGLADSYYLAALKYFEAAIKPMNLKTLQCFGLVAGYSLLTPTRTAVYYIIGLGMRLCQALGLHEEKTVTRGPAAGPLIRSRLTCVGASSGACSPWTTVFRTAWEGQPILPQDVNTSMSIFPNLLTMCTFLEKASSPRRKPR